MAIIQLQADSTTLVLNSHVFTDFIDGDTVSLTPVNELTTRNRSVNSLNIQKRSDSDVYDLAFNIPKYSDDDNWMVRQINAEVPIVFNGAVKEVYYKDGVELVSTYTLTNGSITVQPTETKNNVDGNQERSYTIQFNSAVRS